MALRDMISKLVELWHDLTQRMRADDVSVLRESLRTLAGHPNDVGLMEDIADRLSRVLDPDHPILAAIDIEEDRSPITGRMWTQVILDLKRLLDEEP